jgi:hypothetical protein
LRAAWHRSIDHQESRMKATALASAAGALALLAAQQAAAQTQQPSTTPAAPVHVTIPPGGLTFNFTDIDRNRDNNISIEEWNAYVASLQSKIGAKASSGPAAAGGTAPGKQPQSQPQQAR